MHRSCDACTTSVVGSRTAAAQMGESIDVDRGVVVCDMINYEHDIVTTNTRFLVAFSNIVVCMQVRFVVDLLNVDTKQF